MGCIKVEKTKNYTVMSNYHFKDKRLSFKAKGLLSMMLSLPDDWDYSVAGLVKTSSDGRDSVTSGLKELEKYGYLTREPIKVKGIIRDWDYIIREYPLEKEDIKKKEIIKENISSEKPVTENPLLEKPLLENPQQLNTNILNTNILNTNIYPSNSEKKDDKNLKELESTELEKDFEEIWKFYPNKKGKTKAKELYSSWILDGRALKINKNKKIKLTKEQIMQAVKNYALEVKNMNRELNFIKTGETFFNKALLDYIPTEYEKEKNCETGKNINKVNTNNPKNLNYKQYNQRKYENLDFLYANCSNLVTKEAIK